MKSYYSVLCFFFKELKVPTPLSRTDASQMFPSYKVASVSASRPQLQDAAHFPLVKAASVA